MDFDPVGLCHPDQQQTGDEQQGENGLAPQACTACKKQKRKCDKTLPACSLCQRIGRPCDYRPETQLAAPSPEEFAALRQQVCDLEQLMRSSVQQNVTPATSNGNTSSNDASPPNQNSISPGSTNFWSAPSTFPPLYFLDSNAFLYEKMQVRRNIEKISWLSGALTALGNSQELRAMIEFYFSTVHTYFPVVSKIRLYQHLSNPLHEPGSDIALLFLAMKLACSEVPEGIAPVSYQLYQDVKSFFHFVEAQNGFTIQMIQANLLIALYEMGHSIYPAAYLSIGNTARIGHAMGLHARDARWVPQMLPRPTTWTEQEERRRVWWGVLILDRFINLGHRGKPLATIDPGLEAHLPTDDESWDRGQMLVAAPLALSASQTCRAAPFARTCQSAHLMGKAIRHLDDRTISPDYRFQEALQISRAMRSFADVIPSEHDERDPDITPPLCTSMAICYSSLLTFYDAYSCTEMAQDNAGEDQLLVQQESIDGLKEYSERVLYLARRVKAIIEMEGTAGLSPMIVDSIYQGAANYAWYSRETSLPSHAERFAELKEVLLLLDRRWRVAGQYLFIINDFASREVHH